MVITVTAVTIPQMYEETATLERTPCVLYRLRRTGNLGNFSKKDNFFGEKPSFPTILRTFTPEQERPWSYSVKKNKNGDYPRGHYIKAAYAVPRVAGFP